MAADPTTPREPEIELLGRIAARAIWALRRVLWLGGAAAVGYGSWRVATQAEHAGGFVWIGVGLPLLLPIAWTFGRGRWPVLAVGAAIVWGPSLLADDRDHGWILRFFACLIPCVTLLVWHTVWRLTRSANGGGPTT